ncbi:MAG TPA: ThiF family adenylyltransferase [Candidatus Binatia bacterium]|nr:ThiF family adenylyltransferase [Candidatus Binatia bacterium]
MNKPKLIEREELVPDNTKLLDAFSSSLEELFFIQNPGIKKNNPDARTMVQEFLQNTSIKPVYLNYEDLNVVVKTLPEDEYYKLRTARNRNIISSDEQFNYRNLKVGVAGLSVGSAILNSLVVSGGPKNIKIADHDLIEISNLNRLRARLTDVGENKTKIAAREVYVLDPYAHLELYESGINKDNLEQFLADPKLDVFIDEMDSIDLKVLARNMCRKLQIPVLMATDNGDNVILDVERFDLEPDRPIFHNLVQIDESQLDNMDYKSWLNLAAKIVGPEYLTESMMDSVLEIGKTIASVPQLGTTANIAGAAMSFALRRIANKQEMPSGRYVFGLESALIPNYSSPESLKIRKEKLEKFVKSFAKHE